MWRVILLLLLFLLLARAVWRLLSGVVQGASDGAVRRAGQRPVTPSVRMARDPVCGTFVVPGKALSLVSRGETIYFCSEKCREQYGASRSARA
jgi:YHS domain-containing protein